MATPLIHHPSDLLDTLTADTAVSQVGYKCPLCGAVSVIHQDNVVSRESIKCFQCGKKVIPYWLKGGYSDL